MLAKGGDFTLTRNPRHAGQGRVASLRGPRVNPHTRSHALIYVAHNRYCVDERVKGALQLLSKRYG